MDKKISAIVPCYNEEPNILNMYNRLTVVLQKLTLNYEIVYINDGSTDNSVAIFEDICKKDSHVMVIEFSRNFGSAQRAYSCGLEHVKGDCAVLLDGDLQHPPELIEQMVQKWQEGYEVVYAVRIKRKEKNLVRKIGYKVFYKILKKLSYIDIPLDAGEFSLMDRKVIDAINSLPEKDRLIRGLRAWVGFKSVGINCIGEERVAGKTKLNFMGNVGYAIKGIVSFSYFPLQMITGIAVGMSFIFLIVLISYIICFFISPSITKGFFSLIVFILFVATCLQISMSIIGEYLAKIFEETKSRPEYIIKKILNDNKK